MKHSSAKSDDICSEYFLSCQEREEELQAKLLKVMRLVTTRKESKQVF